MFQAVQDSRNAEFLAGLVEVVDKAPNGALFLSGPFDDLSLFGIPLDSPLDFLLLTAPVR